MGHFFIWLLLFGVIPWPSMSMSTGTANSEASLASVEPVQGSYGGAVLVTILGAGFSGDEYLGSNTVYLRTQLGHPLHNQECLVDEFYTRINRIVCLMPAYFGTSLETAALEGHSSNKDVWDAATDATITFDVFVEGALRRAPAKGIPWDGPCHCPRGLASPQPCARRGRRSGDVRRARTAPQEEGDGL